MNKNKLYLLSLSSDLTRITQSIQKGSFKNSQQFSYQAQKWLKKIDQTTLKPYMKKILKEIKKDLKQKNNLIKAEQALMYSTLVQNYSIKILN